MYRYHLVTIQNMSENKAFSIKPTREEESIQMVSKENKTELMYLTQK